MITTAVVVLFSLLFNNVYTQNTGVSNVHKSHQDVGSGKFINITYFYKTIIHALVFRSEKYATGLN